MDDESTQIADFGDGGLAVDAPFEGFAEVAVQGPDYSRDGNGGFDGADARSIHFRDENTVLKYVNNLDRFSGPIVGGILFGILAYAVTSGMLDYWVKDTPLEPLVHAIHSWTGYVPPSQIEQLPSLEQELSGGPAAPKQPPPFSEEMVENPYWALPNPLTEFKPQRGRVWSAADEENWRVMLSHKYPYQRHKAVEEIHRERLLGSETLLYEALDQEKFWTRAQAFFALSDFGLPTQLVDAQKVVAGAREDLVARYLKRYEAKATPTDIYALRHLIKVVGARQRVAILRILTQARSSINRLYLAGSFYDRDPVVQRWVSREFGRRPLYPRDQIAYEERIRKSWLKNGGEALEPSQDTRFKMQDMKPVDEYIDQDFIDGVEFLGVQPEVEAIESAPENRDDGFGDLEEQIEKEMETVDAMKSLE